MGGVALKAKFVLAGLLVVVVLAAAAGGIFYLQQTHKVATPVSVPAPALAPPPVPPAPVPATPPASSPAVAPAECLLPGPPPALPDGYTATEADMKLSHDSIQKFVLQLEGFQACRDAQADHAPAGTPQEKKTALIKEGDDAVDEAHALANAFAAQLQIFHGRRK